MKLTQKIVKITTYLFLFTSMCLQAQNISYTEQTQEENFEHFIMQSLVKMQNRTGPTIGHVVLESVPTIILPIILRYTQASFEGILALTGAALEQVIETKLHIEEILLSCSHNTKDTPNTSFGDHCKFLNKYLTPATIAVFIFLIYRSPQFRQRCMLALRSAALLGASGGITIALLEDLVSYLKNPAIPIPA